MSRSERLTQIGLDRLVRLKWLEKGAALVLAGNSDKETKAALQDALRGSFRSQRPEVRGSIDKTVTILLKVWLRSPKEMESLRLRGLELLARAPKTERLAVHWGMIMAVYPFWANVAAQVGRLLRLQGTVSATQVQRRIREQYGERETVARRARYVLRSFLDWRVLSETATKGVYQAGVVMAVESPALISWLIEASLQARAGGSAPIKEVFSGPNLFPFRVGAVNAASLSASGELELFRQGLDEDLIILRRKKEHK